MNLLTKEYISGLSQLEMLNADENILALVHVSELSNLVSNINFHQRLALEKAKKIGADAIYFRNYPNDNNPSKPQLYIFDFTVKEQNIVEIHKNIWSSSELRLYLTISKTEIKLFNSSKPVKQNKENELYVTPFEILQIAGEAKEQYQKYSGKEFDNGTFWDNAPVDFGYSETAYEKLITELKNARNYFLKEINLKNKSIASKILVLGILVKYLEERVDIDEKGIETRVFAKDFFNKKEFGFSKNFIETIKKGHTLDLFEYLSGHFNGKIFFLSDDYRKELQEIDLSPLAYFLSGTIDNKQLVLWQLYSFKFLPIELISSIYEVFLDADKNSGIAYTPAYLVNFMLDESMPIEKPKADYKILDPACGSGIFLVSAYKRIIDWWRISEYKKTGKWITPGKEHLIKLKKLLKKSIYGIDIESEAVDLAIFSLSLTLCDILSPKVIWENLRFDDLSNNIIQSDFFEWYSEEKHEQFDLIIGNPPFIEYGSKNEVVNKLTKKTELNNKVRDNQSSLLFTVLSARLIKKKKGLLSFILPAGPLLYNNSEKTISFRKWLFSEYNIPQIVDFTYLSNVLFKNKGNEKNVAVAAVFLENKKPDKESLYHIVVKKLKSAKERQYFELDHYDFHKVSKSEALNNPYVWKSNLLGGGRLVSFIKKLSNFQTLKAFLDKRKKDGWVYGEGFTIGNKKNRDINNIIFQKNSIPTGKFTEKGISKKDIIEKCEEEYFEATRKSKIYTSPLLLIKESIGKKSIPVYLSDSYLTYRNEIMGIHCPDEEKSILVNIRNRFLNNQLFRFFLIATSARAGVTKSTFPVYKQDIINLPFPENEKDIELSEFDEILVNDTLEYGLEFLGKDTNVKSLKAATESELINFGSTFCKVLNSLFETKTKEYSLTKIYNTKSFVCTVFHYNKKNNTNKLIISDKELEKQIAQLIYQKMGSSYRINRVVKLYDDDFIYLLKPNKLRYWLRSVALIDADQTISDLYNAGY